MNLPYESECARAPQIGLIVLQADETIEQDMRQLMPPELEYMVSRVPSGALVTPDSLRAMEAHLTSAAALLPQGARLGCVAYACTSGTAEMGAVRVAQLVQAGTKTAHVTDPVTALIAACRHLDVTRLGLLSPYVASVSDTLRHVLHQAGITVTAFDSFEEPIEEHVVRIATSSIVDAGCDLATGADMDALFLSCTNLRTLAAIPEIEARCNIPVLSSNLVLAWHIARLSQTELRPEAPFRLLTGP